jgi:hypothetical protein
MALLRGTGPSKGPYVTSNLWPTPPVCYATLQSERAGATARAGYRRSGAEAQRFR